MKNREKEKEFKEQVRNAIKIIDFVRKKEMPIRAAVIPETVPGWGKIKEREDET
jgi:hypothetical protein